LTTYALSETGRFWPQSKARPMPPASR